MDGAKVKRNHGFNGKIIDLKTPSLLLFLGYNVEFISWFHEFSVTTEVRIYKDSQLFYFLLATLDFIHIGLYIPWALFSNETIFLRLNFLAKKSSLYFIS